MISWLKKYFIPHDGNEFHPHFFKEKTLVTVLALSLVLFISSFGATSIVKKTNLLATIYPAVLVDLTNKDRHENNVGALTQSSMLTEAAQKKVDDMVAKGYFAHTSPEGRSPWYWFSEVGYNFSYAGENLAVDFTESQDVETAWLESPLHRANVLNGKFTEIGIATAQGMYQGRSTTYVVELFGKPKKVATVEKAPVEIEEPIEQPDQVASVQGAQIEIPEVSTIKEDPEFIAVQNIEDPTEAEVVSPISELVYQTSWLDRVLLNQPHIVNIIFTFLMILVGLALLLFISIEFKMHHRKQAFFGFGLLAILIVLTVFNHSLLLTPYVLAGGL